MVALWASGMNWESSAASVPFRILIVILSSVLALKFFPASDWFRRSPWLIAFWVLYLARLSWDYLVIVVPGAGEAMFFFISTALLPSVALGMAGVRFLPERSTAWLLAIIGGLASVLALFVEFSGLGAERSLMEATGRLSFEALNPISIGHAAATTLLAVICLLRYRMSTAPRLLMVILSLAAFACLLLAGSRGPIVALVLGVAVLTVVYRRWCVLVIVGLLLVPPFLIDGSPLVSRLTDGAADESSQERVTLQMSAIDQFSLNPVLGSAFIDIETKTYPHNIFLEAAMAMGFVGPIVLAVVVLITLLKSWVLIRRQQLLIPLLFIQYFVANQLSGSLWGAAPLWALTAVLMSSTMPLKKKKCEITKISGSTAVT